MLSTGLCIRKMRVGTMNPWHLTTKRRICLDMLMSPPTNYRSEYHSTTIDAVHHHTNPNFSNSLVVPCVLPLALLSAAPTNRHDYSSLR
ncbi:hypothetical protein CPAR01_12242 [Colletotrichum paranaense]|uniref:Uncharacterized protein n=1 Tax=Colletotrichum paranaense TaxID=1914294 RepID=A0ABQ9S9H7_9PEZI|nr:uncharacterized protein CPAR01_12242 [Colletotrichum paranaense]KAK1529930.1 hypothetical protein CPAR01_12242 [Colletotrichum paranaense]